MGAGGACCIRGTYRICATVVGWDFCKWSEGWGLGEMELSELEA